MHPRNSREKDSQRSNVSTQVYPSRDSTCVGQENPLGLRGQGCPTMKRFPEKTQGETIFGHTVQNNNPILIPRICNRGIWGNGGGSRVLALCQVLYLAHPTEPSKQGGGSIPFSQMGTTRSERLSSRPLHIILSCTAPDLGLGLEPGSRRAPKKGKEGQTRDNLHRVSHTDKKL